MTPLVLCQRRPSAESELPVPPCDNKAPLVSLVGWYQKRSNENFPDCPSVMGPPPYWGVEVLWRGITRHSSPPREGHINRGLMNRRIKKEKLLELISRLTVQLQQSRLWFRWKHRHTGECKKIENPEINPQHKSGQLMFDKGGCVSVEEGPPSQQMVLDQLDIHGLKTEPRPKPHTLYKN